MENEKITDCSQYAEPRMVIADVLSTLEARPDEGSVFKFKEHEGSCGAVCRQSGWPAASAPSPASRLHLPKIQPWTKGRQGTPTDSWRVLRGAATRDLWLPTLRGTKPKALLNNGAISGGDHTPHSSMEHVLVMIFFCQFAALCDASKA